MSQEAAAVGMPGAPRVRGVSANAEQQKQSRRKSGAARGDANMKAHPRRAPAGQAPAPGRQ